MKCGTVAISSHAIIFPESDAGGGGGTCKICQRIEISRWPTWMPHTSNRVCSAIILWNPMPTPSITARNIAHIIAPFLAALMPPRIAKDPPVKNPAITVEGAISPCLGLICLVTDDFGQGRLTGVIRIFFLSDAFHSAIIC